MPELPEVQTIVNSLKNYENKKIVKISVFRESILSNISKSEFESQLENKILKKIFRRGKFILFEFLDNSIMLIHLKMSGKIIISKRFKENSYCRILLEFENSNFINYIDTRALGRAWYYKSLSHAQNDLKTLREMGVEPLSEFDQEVVIKTIQTKVKAIKSVLLDQKIICGIGNIYADEILFLTNIHPATKACLLKTNQIKKIIDITREVLTKAIKLGGSSIRNYTNTQGVNGNYQSFAYVYGRKNEPCRICQSLIVKIFINNRGSHFCPKCQKQPRNN